METQLTKSNIKASRVAATTFGVLAGLGGLWHGIGEVRQGNIATGSIYINSWAEGPIATNMGGEPGMTIVPNFLVTGLLCIAVSLAVIVWAAAMVQRKRGGIILIGLSIGMMLVGGGFGPPLIGILAGVSGTRVNSPLSLWRTRTAKTQRFMAKVWPLAFVVGAASGILLVIGSVILVYFFGDNNADFFTNNFYFTALVLIVIILAGAARDARFTHSIKNY